MAKRRPGRSPAPIGAVRAASPSSPGLAARAAILIVVGALAYASALSGPFLFDDQTAIVDNAQIRSLSPSEALAPPRDTPVAGRPLVNLSFALNYAVGGLGVRGYRAVNLLIHLTAGVVLFGVLRRAFQLPVPARRYATDATDLAFAAALLWVLHPLVSEVVNYVTERSESLMGLCYLLTVYCGFRALRARDARWTAGAVVACAAGMACKESMVTAPVAVVLLDRVLVLDSWRAAFTARRRLYLGLAATWCLLGALLLTAPRTSVGFTAGTSAWVYLLNQAQIVTRYLQLAVWPRALVLDYGLPVPLTPGDVLLPGLFIVGLVVATIAVLVYRPGIGVLGALFFLTLAPTSSVVPIATEVGAERRMYLPLVPLVVLAVLGSHWLIGRLQATPAERRVPPWLGAAALAAVSGLLIAGLQQRNREYASPLTMARTIVDRWPNGRGHFLLGSTLVQSGQEDAGMAELRASARDYPGALFAIGTELLGAGKLDEGIDALQQFVRALPNHTTVFAAREMMGRAYAGQGNLPAAREQLEQVVQLAPRYPVGHDLLGRVLVGQGAFPEAVAQFQAVLALTPGDVQARRNLEAAQRRAAGQRPAPGAGP